MLSKLRQIQTQTDHRTKQLYTIVHTPTHTWCSRIIMTWNTLPTLLSSFPHCIEQFKYANNNKTIITVNGIYLSFTTIDHHWAWHTHTHSASHTHMHTHIMTWMKHTTYISAMSSFDHRPEQFKYANNNQTTIINYSHHSAWHTHMHTHTHTSISSVPNVAFLMHLT